MSRLTQAEIAKKLQISQSAVSLTISDPSTSRVSRETKNKIIDFIKENSPSILRKHSIVKPICYLSQKLYEANKNDLFARLLTGAEEEARESKLNLVFKRWQKKTDLADIFRDGEFAGIIYCGEKDEKTIKYLQKFAAVVVLNGIIDPLICSMVSIDNHGGIRMAVKHCYDMGHRKIAFAGITSNCKLGHMLERIGGYYEAHHLLGLAVNNNYMFNCSDNSESKVIKKIISMKNSPTAIICFNDNMAISLMKAAMEQGVRIPDDLSFVGFDNADVGKNWLPALTTVHQKREDMGRAAVALLSRKINEGREEIPEKVLCEAGLIVRDSVARL